MPLDTLPDELLEEIFSYLGSKQRMDLSLVNQRWFRILSRPRFTQDIKLRINQRSDVIPVNVLFNSKRVYQHLYCSITDGSDVFVRFILADLLKHCVQRWNVLSLEIHAYYDRLLLFLQDNRYLLEGLQALFLRVENIFRGETPPHGVPIDDHMVLELKNLQILNWSYSASETVDNILSFVTPQLRRLEMCHFLPQPGILGSIEFSRTRMYICWTLRNLQELYLCKVSVSHREYQLELPHLRKLTLESLVHGTLVILEAPCLTELITDFRSFNSLWWSNVTNTLRHVEFHLCRDCKEDIRGGFRGDYTNFFEYYANQITKLTLVSHVEDTPFEKFSYLLDLFPKIESLHVHQFNLPSSMDQRGPVLKKILITNCTTHARALYFPAQTECVRVYQLQGPRGEISLFPADLNHPRLESADIPARWYHLTTRANYSTRGFRYQAEEDGDYPSTQFRNHNHKGWKNLDLIVDGPEVEIVSE